MRFAFNGSSCAVSQRSEVRGLWEVQGLAEPVHQQEGVSHRVGPSRPSSLNHVFIASICPDRCQSAISSSR